MIHMLLVVVVLAVLLLVLGVSASLGRFFGCRQVEKHAKHQLEVVSVAEGAVFGLLGLLIAFTFSGAYDRYESKKLLILQEANTFDAAYEYIDVVPEKYQPILRDNVRKYLDLHIASYRDIPFAAKVGADLNKAIEIQHKIWQTVIAAGKENPNNELTQLAIPAMSKMFDAFHTGINRTLVHPPLIIFVLLIGLAALGAFLVGYNAAEHSHKYPMHTLFYVLLTAFVIFIIMNLEYPRLGFIRYNSFDQMLLDVREDMNDHSS